MTLARCSQGRRAGKYAGRVPNSSSPPKHRRASRLRRNHRRTADLTGCRPNQVKRILGNPLRRFQRRKPNTMALWWTFTLISAEGLKDSAQLMMTCTDSAMTSMKRVMVPGSRVSSGPCVPHAAGELDGPTQIKPCTPMIQNWRAMQLGASESSGWKHGCSRSCKKPAEIIPRKLCGRLYSIWKIAALG
jgi:hypothetical protein